MFAIGVSSYSVIPGLSEAKNPESIITSREFQLEP